MTDESLDKDVSRELSPASGVKLEQRERPILFSAPMVSALLAGTKTQTRRVVKPQPAPHETWDWSWPQPRGTPGTRICWRDDVRQPNLFPYCPYGVPGDTLWVREEFSGPFVFTGTPPREWLQRAYQREGARDPEIWFWADGQPDCGDWTKPKPSIHMPRWASRITLQITDVRVERLNEISHEDCWAEGVICDIHGAKKHTCCSGLTRGYQKVWEAINGPGSWAENPWVWAVSFEVVE